MLEKQLIKKVNVVCMTHFDLGFTDLAERVLSRYVETFIPQAIDLARQMNTGGKKRFVWTLGAYLIDHYLCVAEEDAKERLQQAILRGDISYHGLALTTHTELMDSDLLDFDLSYAKHLDRRFGRKTIAAKLTDVPGHTRAMIPHMEAHGIQYLHIGVNPSSMNPEVPKTFLWKSGQHELLVQYSSEYGSACYVDGMEEVLEFVFLGDNMGIPSREAILEKLDLLQKEYPNAEVEAATLEAYARQVWKHKDDLPVITEEIGDTWIHGIAADPSKTMCFKRLLGFKDGWKKEGVFDVNKKEYHEFMENLLLISEHTWAMDYKKYLFDFVNWTKADFQKARKENDVTNLFFTDRNMALMRSVCEEKHTDRLESSYEKYESSYQEQQNYLWKAIKALPAVQYQEAVDRLDQIKKRFYPMTDGGKEYYAGEVIRINGWGAAFDGTGALVYLEKDQKNWIQQGCFGRFSYETYNALDCVSEYYQYNHAFKENMVWSEADFSKPGLETVEDLEHRNYPFDLRRIKVKNQTIELTLAGNGQAVRQYGCPRKALIRYTFGNEITCELIWTEKSANKMPEALWFDFNFDVENPYRWKMEIMKELISPMDVVKGGNRRQHCVEKMRYDGADGKIEIDNLDSPLISAGGRRLYGGCKELPDISKGFSYCLFNNKWGTNFPVWCEDDCYFTYILKIETN